jgi:HEAT repeat protein
LFLGLIACCRATAAQEPDTASLIQQLTSPDAQERKNAIDALGDLGPAAKKAVPQLTKLLGDEDEHIRWHALRSLGAIGPDAAPAVDALAERLKDKSPVVRAYAAFALGRIGNASKPAAPALVEGIKDPDRLVRRECVRALRAMKLDPDVAIPLFVEMLNNAAPGELAPALGALAEGAAAAVPSLKKAIQDFPQARYWACLILAEIGPEAKEAVPELVACLKDDDAEIRREAIAALGRIGPSAKQAVPAIANALADQDAGVRYTAAYSLGVIGPEAAGAMAALQKLSGEKDPLMQIVSGWALLRLDPKNEASRKAIMELGLTCADHENPRVRAAVVNVLADLHQGEPEVTAALVKALADEQLPVVLTASNALVKAGAPSIAPLVEALGRSDLRANAAATLSRFGKDARPAVPALIKALEDDRAAVRREAVLALTAIGPDAQEAVPALLERLRGDSHWDVRRVSAKALGQIAAERPEVMAALRQATEDKDPDVRDAAKEAIQPKPPAKVEPKQ